MSLAATDEVPKSKRARPPQSVKIREQLHKLNQLPRQLGRISDVWVQTILIDACTKLMSVGQEPADVLKSVSLDLTITTRHLDCLLKVRDLDCPRRSLY